MAQDDETASSSGDEPEKKEEEVSEAKPAEKKKEGPFREPAKKKGASPLPRTGGLAAKAARFVFWLVWFVSIPFAFACFVVWALSPPSGVEHTGILGWIESIVREQPVPVGIVAFTVAEAAIWNIRRRLPLAKFAYAPVRKDVPKEMREAFERALILIEEADTIFKANTRAVKRDLTVKERDRLKAELEKLANEMTAEPFDKDAFIDALAASDKEVDQKLGRWRKSEAREYLESILLAVAVALTLRAFVVEAFKIPSGSMIPTLQVGDHIFVNKFSYGPAIPYTHSRLWTNMPPHRGDVMVFAYPEHPEQDFIKRVIAIPGDKLDVRGGHPVINGWEVPHCEAGVYSYTEDGSLAPHHEGDLFVEFLEDEAYLTLYDRMGGFPDIQGPYTCGPNEVWVMGDNRNNSHDSRMWFGGQGGGVPFENIRGRALFVWLSVADGGIDWTRMGAPVMGRPRLPPAMKSLEPAIEKCLRERPPLDKTTPPSPK
jgi:signal peptidase I